MTSLLSTPFDDCPFACIQSAAIIVRGSQGEVSAAQRCVVYIQPTFSYRYWAREEGVWGASSGKGRSSPSLEQDKLF
jgi:hypothetical protein